MKSVACLGWYGHGNFGDELILAGLRELFKDWQLQVFSSDNRGAYPIIDFDAVNKCDLFVLGGGELINSRFLWMPYPRFTKHPRIYKLYAHTPFAQDSWISKIKIPKIILGCGFDVSNAGEIKKNVLQDLEQFSYIGARDSYAYGLFNWFPQIADKVGLFYDLAYAIKADPVAISYLAKLFPIKLHGLILAHMTSSFYTLYPYHYHRKIQRVNDTIQKLSPQQIRERQKMEFQKCLQSFRG